MFESKKIVAFFDADPAGIMFFGNLFRHIHAVYEEFLGCVHPEIDYFNHAELVFPIIHTEADYSVPFYLHEEMAVKISVSKLKTSSFEISYNIYGKNNKLKATAKTVHVCVQKVDMNKFKLPNELTDYLKRFAI